jgi:hypothetical protein
VVSWLRGCFCFVVRAKALVDFSFVIVFGDRSSDASGSSAFVGGKRREEHCSDRFKSFVLDRVDKIGRNEQHCSKYCSQYYSKFTVL